MLFLLSLQVALWKVHVAHLFAAKPHLFPQRNVCIAVSQSVINTGIVVYRYPNEHIRFQANLQTVDIIHSGFNGQRTAVISKNHNEN